MEPLSETIWDVLISGTGLQNSLLALALSRSDKKVLHVDGNDHYGAAEAAFSLQEVDEWVEKVGGGSSTPFRNAQLWKKSSEDGDETNRLSFSRAYTLALSPQIIYARSRLLANLVSSKVYRQLEFQAVGNWWILDGSDASSMSRLPNGREDIFQDKSIDNRAKRGLMKFLKFVVDYDNQTDVWEAHAESSLGVFLSSQFQLPANIHSVISALTLSLDSLEETKVRWALPRIAKHLTSFGVFGPGFAAVLPKWGGNAEIAQVACRAGAVNGGVYVLGTNVSKSESLEEDSDHFEKVALSNGDIVRTRHLVADVKPPAEQSKSVSKLIAIVSSGFPSLFTSSVEGAALAAVIVVVIAPHTLDSENCSQPSPIYLMVHSSETGECPHGQSILYTTTLHSDSHTHALLDLAISAFLKATGEPESHLLYRLYYEQEQVGHSDAALDLAFNDEILDNVETAWKKIMADDGSNTAGFMKFDDREGHGDEDEDGEEY